MTGHRNRLNEVAEAHGLRPLTGEFSIPDYVYYAADLTLLALGLLKAEEIEPPKTWREIQASVAKSKWWQFK